MSNIFGGDLLILSVFSISDNHAANPTILIQIILYFILMISVLLNIAKIWSLRISKIKIMQISLQNEEISSMKMRRSPHPSSFCQYFDCHFISNYHTENPTILNQTIFDFILNPSILLNITIIQSLNILKIKLNIFFFAK